MAVLRKQVTLKNPGVAVGSSQPQVIVACGSVAEGITRSLDPYTGRMLGWKYCLSCLLGSCALSSLVLITTTPEGRGKSHDMSKSLVKHISSHLGQEAQNCPSSERKDKE